MKYTSQQEAIIQEMSTGLGPNLVIDARAGSSKTTMTVAGAQAMPQKTVVNAFAFNKSIAVELGERMPTNVQCKTFNALGHGSWMRRVASNVKIDLKPRKTWLIADKIPGENFTQLGQMVGLCKAHGIVPQGAIGSPKGLLPDEPQTYTDLADKYAIDSNGHPDPIGLVREVLIRSIDQAWKGLIDFDDQLYMPVICRGEFPKGDVVMVDEAQDVSMIQRAIINKMTQNEERLIAVGDRYQSIYAFRGAMSDSIPNLVSSFGATVLPLTTSFRCPQAVIKEAQKYVNDIEAWSEAQPGLVETLKDNWDPSDFKNKQATILCRNNAPLVGLCFYLMANKIGATIRGRDVFGQIKKLIVKLKAKDIDQLLTKLYEYQEKEAIRLEQRKMFQSVANLDDRCKCITILSNAVQDTGSNQVSDVINQFESMFNDRSNPPIILSTIHKAKGLEWPRVFILDKDLMPSRFAKTPEDFQQETNLQYVATTRSQSYLGFIQSPNHE